LSPTLFAVCLPISCRLKYPSQPSYPHNPHLPNTPHTVSLPSSPAPTLQFTSYPPPYHFLSQTPLFTTDTSHLGPRSLHFPLYCVPTLRSVPYSPYIYPFHSCQSKYPPITTLISPYSYTHLPIYNIPHYFSLPSSPASTYFVMHLTPPYRFL
jgi:hypothetical protein